MAATAPADPTEVRRRGRQRLIGAVAIVLLAVVFVPMVLDPEPRQDRKEPALAIPPKESAPALPAPAPAKTQAPTPAPEAPKVAAKIEPPKKAEPLKTQPGPKTTEPLMPKVAVPPAPKRPDPAVVAASEPKAAVPAPAPTSAAAPKLEGFAVQIGAFKDEEKLKQARERLAAAKITHFIERLPSSDLTRLRAGPYPTREAAEKGRAAIALAGLQGQVVPLP